MEQTFIPVIGIFDDTEVFTKYRVAIQFTEWVVGGIPQKPEIIESWLRQRILGDDEELRIQLIKTLSDLDIDVPTNATREEIIAAASAIAATRNGNTFRRGADGLCLASYNPKAMLKEATNILFAGERWGVTRKGPKSYLAERVYVDEYQIPLGRTDPDGTMMQVGQVSGPKGPRSTLTYYDYCIQPAITFTVSSAKDCIEAQQWRDILVLGQRLGIGALRSLGYGQFKITAFDRI